MMSLTRRMILSASLVLAVFMALTALGLERAFYESARSARQERLLGQLYLLIAAAEVDGQGRLSLPDALSEARFSLPGSGLYAVVADQDGSLLWRSPSALNIAAPFLARLAPGEKRFEAGTGFFVQSLGVKWAVGRDHYAFTFSVSEDRAEFNAQIGRYRQSLWAWLAGLAALLLLAQATVLRWGLRPLRGVAGELNAIESGRQESLQGVYPEEIQRLTDNLNSLLQHEREQRQRYRNALADLAHSLKTPLAVMRGALGGDAAQLPATVEEQVARMDGIVAYQLQRAATASQRPLHAQPIALLPLAQKIIAALRKVHRDKPVQVEIAWGSDLQLPGDAGDWMELLGNLLENAFKWCAGRIALGVLEAPGRCELTIEDDGTGIDPAQVERVLQRGVRADEAVPGHGIGLAVVRDIVAAYQGKIEIGRGRLGGAAIRLIFPRRAP
jgi:two-component system sensor histidine kinase PhoQ